MRSLIVTTQSLQNGPPQREQWRTPSMTSGWLRQGSMLTSIGRFDAGMLPHVVRGEEHGREVADEVLAADGLLLEPQLLAIARRHFLHQVVARGVGHAVVADAEGEEERALVESDAGADEAEHARGAQRVVAPLRRELALVRERLRVADHDSVGDDVAEAAARGPGEQRDRADAVERRREVQHAGDVAHQRLVQRYRQPAGIDHAQAQRALPGRAAMMARLEVDVPSPR